MKDGKLKTFLAASGAFFLSMVLLTMLIAMLKGGGPSGTKIGVVEIDGMISKPEEITKTLVDYGKRDDIKAVILRINSPGGAVGPSQEIYSEVLRLKKKKKVVASMGTVAASGGYYIASAADSIVANPGTITGSIGVIVEFMNFEGLLSKLGLRGDVIKSGKFKDTGSPFKDMTPAERKYMQVLIDDVHDQFIEAVATGRGMDKEEVRKLSDGRIFTGKQALKEGLIDSLGSLTDAVDKVKEMAKIEGEHHLVYPVKKVSLLQAIAGEEAGAKITEIGQKNEFSIMYLFGGID